MDPSAILCKYKNSFDNMGAIPNILHIYISSNSRDSNSVKTRLILSDSVPLKIDSNYNNKYCDPSLLNQANKNRLDDKLTDPFKKESYEPFMNRDSIILANMDMVFNFSKHTSGYILKQESVKDLSFAAMGDGPGGFSQYMMYRNPSSYGFGNTPIEYPFNKYRLDPTHFNIIQGPSKKGDIQLDYKHFVKSIRTVEATGLDVILGNYPDTNVTDIGYLVRLLVALSVGKIGCVFISKVKLNSELMIDLIYITSKCFDKITLFKPLSTDLNDNIYYLVAQGSNINNMEWISYLNESYEESIKKNKQILRLLDRIPTDIEKWITEYHNLILMYEHYLYEIRSSGITELYDVYKCKALWNLPKI
jgi:hypothetical protein